MNEAKKEIPEDLQENDQREENLAKVKEQEELTIEKTPDTSEENPAELLIEKNEVPSEIAEDTEKIEVEPVEAPENKSDQKKDLPKDHGTHLPEEKTESAGSKTVDKQPEIASVDYAGFSNKELVSTCSIIVSERPVQEIREDIERIKTIFYKNLKVEYDKKKETFLKDGGNPEDFNPDPDPLELELKVSLDKYKHKKSVFNKQIELEKQSNLEEKYRIIESIKNLVNKEESINKTFQEFRDLQIRWRTIGLVPQSKLKDLWESYHYHVEKFYDYIKINKELRDLDLKKNMELKNYLCDKAENLLLEPNIVLAFKTLQSYHERWREIGPVPHEIKEALWERFKSATAKINKKHQEYFEILKEGLKKNLQAKTELCEKVEQILGEEIKTHRDWERNSKNIIELQKIWKTIGFAPKKHNSLIYERFRNACDSFFIRKRDFYTANKEIQRNNLQIKTDLCIQAEALQKMPAQ